MYNLIIKKQNYFHPMKVVNTMNEMLIEFNNDIN